MLIITMVQESASVRKTQHEIQIQFQHKDPICSRYYKNL